MLLLLEYKVQIGRGSVTIRLLNLLKLQLLGNQGTLQALVPLLVIDVWEHADYLQYENVCVDYLEKVWDIVNCKTIAERFAKVQQ